MKESFRVEEEKIFKRLYYVSIKLYIIKIKIIKLENYY